MANCVGKDGKGTILVGQLLCFAFEGVENIYRVGLCTSRKKEVYEMIMKLITEGPGFKYRIAVKLPASVPSINWR